MNVKQIRRMLEKLDDALDDVEIEIETANDEVETANGERDDYALQLEEARGELDKMAEELKLLCQLLFDAKIDLPRDRHFVDINPYVSKADPYRGMYEIGY